MTDLSRWPALVLTAGLATRLRPLSLVRAKAAMPVAGTPLIARILTWLRAAGVRRAVLNLHHLPETITRVVGDGSAFDLEVKYSWEPEVLGSAGGPRHALPLLDADRFLVVNGDTLTDCDLRALATQHEASGARVTMAVVEGDVDRYGGVLADAGDLVHGFGKRRDGLDALHFIGAQAVDAGVFAPLADGVPAETVKALYPELIRQSPGAVTAWRSAATFFDVGTARDYLATVAAFAAHEGRGFDVGAGGDIATDARVTHTILWDRVRVGRGASLDHCIVADDVVLPEGARFSHRVLVAGAAGVEDTPL